MPHSQGREFGKRHVPQRSRTVAPPLPAETVIHEVQKIVPAQIRIEMDEVIPPSPRSVPHSFRAALLSGFVTGCFLTGLDLGQPAFAAPALFDGTGLDGLMEQAAPSMVVLSLLTGTRAAVSTMLLSHRLLAALEQTSPGAYALMGAAINILCAAVIQNLQGSPPAHGWLAEIAAGAVAGLFYRLFAGAKFAAREDLSPART